MGRPPLKNRIEFNGKKVTLQTAADIAALHEAEERKLAGTQAFREAFEHPGTTFVLTQNVKIDQSRKLGLYDTLSPLRGSVPPEHPIGMRRGSLVVFAETKRLSVVQKGKTYSVVRYLFLLFGDVRRYAITDMSLLELFSTSHVG